MAPSERNQRAIRPTHDGRTSQVKQESLLDEVRMANERLVLASVREQELAEKAETQTAQFNALLNEIAEGVLIVNPSGEIVFANPLARKLVGLPEEGELTAEGHWDAIRICDCQGKPLVAEARPLARAIRGDSFRDYEVDVQIISGTSRRLMFTGGAIRDASGQVLRAIITVRDVTELRHLERQREDYLSLISHDLRTPLSVIITGTGLLIRQARGKTEFPLTKTAETILRNAQRMEAMIGDLLETTRLESGRFILRKEPLNLAEAIRAVVDDLVPVVERSRVRIELTAPLPPIVADPKRVERVLMNLLANAIKFSSTGSPIEILVGRRDDQAVVSVVDHGVGISDQDKAHLFERFYQTSDGLKRQGLGLGLYLSRLIIQASGGEIWVTSAPGAGSTFSFSLPIH